MPYTGVHTIYSEVYSVGYIRSLAYNGEAKYNLDGACDRQQNSQKTKIFDDLVITGTMKRQFKTNKFYLCMLAVAIRMSAYLYTIMYVGKMTFDKGIPFQL